MVSGGGGGEGGSYNFKVVLLGEGCVGKSSLVLRYVEDIFNPKHVTTIQASFLNKKITVNSKRINLCIWDTAGQERFHALGPIYYRSSDGAILVYDITDQDSFQKVKNWVRELKKMLGSEIILTIVGNKIDLEKERRVQHQDAVNYAAEVGARHYETSAKVNEGIEELFLDLTNQMVEVRDRKLAAEAQLRSNSLRRGHTLRLEGEFDNDNEHIPGLSTSSAGGGEGRSGRCCH